MAPIVRLVAMCTAAEAVEALGRVICAQTKIFELRKAGLLGAPRDIAAEIEHGMFLALRGLEVATVRRISSKKSLDKFGADFVVRLADRRSERRGDASPPGAKPFHRNDRSFDNS